MGCQHHKMKGSLVPRSDVEENPSSVDLNMHYRVMTSLSLILKYLGLFVIATFPFLDRTELYLILSACLMSKYSLYSQTWLKVAIFYADFLLLLS